MSEPARCEAAWVRERRASGAGGQRAQPHRGRAGERRAGPGSRAARPVPLRLVADGGRLVPRAAGQSAGAGQDRVRTAARPRVPSGAPPLRLTRRGRIVVTAAAVLTIGAAFMALAGAAQATGPTGHAGQTGQAGAPGAPGSGVATVVIRPGESLWSVAESYDPDADTRLVIQQILQLNSLTSDQLQPGQVLWVPRG